VKLVPPQWPKSIELVDLAALAFLNSKLQSDSKSASANQAGSLLPDEIDEVWRKAEQFATMRPKHLSADDDEARASATTESIAKTEDRGQSEVSWSIHRSGCACPACISLFSSP
jgi:hypothetical protein